MVAAARLKVVEPSEARAGLADAFRLVEIAKRRFDHNQAQLDEARANADRSFDAMNDATEAVAKANAAIKEGTATVETVDALQTAERNAQANKMLRESALNAASRYENDSQVLRDGIESAETARRQAAARVIAEEADFSEHFALARQMQAKVFALRNFLVTAAIRGAIKWECLSKSDQDFLSLFDGRNLPVANRSTSLFYPELPSHQAWLDTVQPLEIDANAIVAVISPEELV